MGLWTKLFGGTEGCREAMRESYEKHVREARREGIKGSSPHEVGLYGALGTRYIVRGTPVAEVILRGEIAPFLVMKEAEAVEALAEYVVFQERPKDARVAWLKKAINSSLRSCRETSRTAMAAAGLINQVAWCALLEPDTLKVVEDAVEKIQQGSESQSTSKKNEEASVRAMWRGKSTGTLRPGVKGKVWIEGTQYCFQPDGEDVSVMCQREDILSDGPPQVRRPQEVRKEVPQRRVVTAEQLGLELSVATLQAANDLLHKFEKAGVTAQFTNEKYTRLGWEIALFELVCRTLALVRTYGQAGYKIASFLAHETLTALAKNASVNDVPKFVDAALQLLDSHYQYYAQDIWQFGHEDNDGNKMGIALGMKILRRILNPVIGISLAEPAIDWKEGQDLTEFFVKVNEAHKEWKEVPNVPILSTTCFIHAVTSILSEKLIAQEFTLSED